MMAVNRYSWQALYRIIQLLKGMQLKSLKTAIYDDDDGHYTGRSEVRGDGHYSGLSMVR